ncbi:MAG: hypothetical protein PF489_11710, partial [Salinivirgaceae bacterium]|nr:hypothetical protein [Salinivirgaceae bacterium]
GTSTDWAVKDEHETFFYTSGSLVPSKVEAGVVCPHFLVPVASKIKRVVFYGSGCAMHSKALIVEKKLMQWFQNAEVAVYSDLLALAHIGLPNAGGLVGILGTGASLAAYDGYNLQFGVMSKGKELDPGSGTDLGKELLHAFQTNSFPKEVRDSLSLVLTGTSSQLSNEERCTRFLFENVEMPSLKALCVSRFEAYFDYYLGENMPAYPKMIFGGTIAHKGRDILSAVAATFAIEVVGFVAKPIKRLSEIT